MELIDPLGVKRENIPKIIKIGKDLAVTIPEDIAKKLDLREGMPVHMFEVTAGTAAFEKVKSIVTLTNDDVDMLKKLLQFRFEERTPERLETAFSTSEKKKLADMIKRRIVNIYFGGKYVNGGVYNVPTMVYRQYQQQVRPEPTLATHVQVAAASKLPVSIPSITYQKIERSDRAERPDRSDQSDRAEKSEKELSPAARLEKQGFLVVPSESEAKELSDSLSSRIKKKDIIGIRGFDKKYYIVKASFVIKNASKVRSFLKAGAKSADSVAEGLGMDKQGAIALLTILNEQGELIEKRRGTFALAD